MLIRTLIAITIEKCTIKNYCESHKQEILKKRKMYNEVMNKKELKNKEQRRNKFKKKISLRKE